MLRALALSLLLVAWAGAARAACYTIPGAGRLLDNPSTRFLILGEVHGTVEEPAAFGDLICLAAERPRPVVVALEYHAEEQPALDAYLASDGGAEARRAFLTGGRWITAFKNGQSSTAMFDLIERLRVMKAAGEIAGVMAFIPDAPFTDAAAYERRMANGLMAVADRYPDALVIVLVGRLHARRTPVTAGGSTYDAATMYLPMDRTVSLEFSAVGGQAWVCQTGDCGPRSIIPITLSPSAGVFLNVQVGDYNGSFAIGRATMASAPAVVD